MPRGNFTRVWTLIYVNILKDLVPQGFSASEIAAKLNQDHHTKFTRNAVIGAAHRNGLSTQGLPNLKKPRPERQKTERPKKERPPKMKREPQPPFGAVLNLKCRPLPPPIDDGLVPKHATLFQVVDDDGCRWPYGDGPTYSFCGHPRMKCDGYETHYCPTHFSLSCGGTRQPPIYLKQTWT